MSSKLSITRTSGYFFRYFLGTYFLWTGYFQGPLVSAPRAIRSRVSHGTQGHNKATKPRRLGSVQWMYFVLMDNSAATLIKQIGDSYSRKDSTTGSQIAAAILKPVADFTAEPSPTNDLITWTPEAVGDFWYTCSVVGHTTMTGKISVVPEPSSFALIASAVAFALVCLRRR